MLGFYHMKKAIELDFNNIDYKVYMLSTFANSPEIVIPKEYVNHIVSEILTKDPNNEVALRFSGEIGDVRLSNNSNLKIWYSTLIS